MTKKDREKIAKFFNEAEDWKEFALEEYKAGEEKKKKEEGEKK
ncbi:hypothetical protein ES703_85596 [subsurface metagenome]